MYLRYLFPCFEFFDIINVKVNKSSSFSSARVPKEKEHIVFFSGFPNEYLLYKKNA